MLYFSNKKQYLIGIDLKEDHVCLVKMDKVRQIIDQVAIADFGHRAIIEGKWQDSRAILQALQQVIQETHSEGLLAAIALPAKSVIIKPIKLTESLSPEECEAEMESNMSHYLPGFDETLCCDFVRVDSQTLLLIAARQVQLNDTIQLITQAGLRVKIVDVDSYALIRGVLAVHRDRVLLAILEINNMEARFFIYQKPDIVISEIFTLESLENDLKQALQRFEFIHRNHFLDSILICGHHSLPLEQFVAKIKNEISIHCEVLNPFSNLSLQEESNPLISQGARFLTSIGLASRRLPAC